MHAEKKDIMNREDVEKLVRRFYARVIPDELIGFFFTQTVKVDWSTHLPKMYDFWESVIFDKPVYNGNPMQVHMHIHQMQPMQAHHFERWLKLFRETLDENFSGPTTEKTMQRAMSIATIIQIKTSEK